MTAISKPGVCDVYVDPGVSTMEIPSEFPPFHSNCRAVMAVLAIEPGEIHGFGFPSGPGGGYIYWDGREWGVYLTNDRSRGYYFAGTTQNDGPPQAVVDSLRKQCIALERRMLGRRLLPMGGNHQ